jgi:hypothetical protein
VQYALVGAVAAVQPAKVVHMLAVEVEVDFHGPTTSQLHQVKLYTYKQADMVNLIVCVVILQEI